MNHIHDLQEVKMHSQPKKQLSLATLYIFKGSPEMSNPVLIHTCNKTMCFYFGSV